MCISSDGYDEIALLCRPNCAFKALQMRAHIVILDQPRGKHRTDLLLVAYSHSFQTSIILFDLLLVPVTVQLTNFF